MNIFRLLMLLVAAIFSLPQLPAAAEARLLWEIGQLDTNNTEFALAPKSYGKFREEGFFVVGQSTPKEAWPYVHPGPQDAWAGNRAHTFSIVFGVEQAVSQGSCQLCLDLLDTQSKTPPQLRVEVNGRKFERLLTPGDSDASVQGNPGKGKRSRAEIEFPAQLLKAGNNLVLIENFSGSWLLYDRVALAAPAAVKSAPVANFTALRSVEVSPAVAEKDGQRSQRITATLVHGGEPLEVSLQLDQREMAKAKLTGGAQTITADMPAVEKSRQAVFAVAANGQPLATREIKLMPGLRQVVVVFKTHFDIGYTDMASNVVKRYRTGMIDDALKVVDQNRNLPPEQQFVWTLAGWPLSKIMEDWPGQNPDRKKRLQAAFKEGRFVVHALPFTTHTELLEPEDLVRGLNFASRLSRAASLELPRDAKMTDVPCHAWIMPTLLRHAGVDFLHLGCNAASQSPQVPRLFWWEGPDGSRLLTMYTAESYGTGLAPPKDWPYQTWLALIHTGDNHGPPTPDEVKKLLDDAKQKLPGVTVRIGRLSDFADGILGEKADVPVVRGDMPDTWIHGPMCDPAGAKIARNIRPAIAMAEALDTQAQVWGIYQPNTAALLAHAYEQSLLYGEHTWGGALYWVTRYGAGTKWSYGDTWRQDQQQNRFKRLEDSWAEHTAYIETARDAVIPLLAQELDALASATKGTGRRIVVYNPLPWKRDGLISVKGDRREYQAIQPADGDEVIVGTVVDDRVQFVVRDIPAMGYRCFVPTMASVALFNRTNLENQFFKVEFDAARGTIRSLIDKRSGRELVDATAACGFGQYLYERFDSNNVAGFVKAYVKISSDWAINELGKPSMPPADQAPYQAASPRQGTLSFSMDSGGVQQAVMKFAKTAELPHAVTIKVILYNNLPVVDLEVILHDKPADPWPEAGWICLPFKVDQPQFRLGRQASIIDPVKDIIPGANRHLLGLNTGAAVFDAQGRGMGFCPQDNPLISLDSPGCWKFNYDFVPKKAHVYVNLFNNQWTTNFRLWNSGTWTSRVRLWAFDRFEPEPALVTPSLEARFPLQAAVALRPGNQLPATQRGLELSRKGVLVTAFGVNPDGPGKVLRLWEYAGNPGPCRVHFPDDLQTKSVQPIDLRGRATGQPLPIKDGVLEVDLKAFAPASFLINF